MLGTSEEEEELVKYSLFIACYNSVREIQYLESIFFFIVLCIQIDNIQMNQTTNKMVLKNQFQPIASCSKSMLFRSPETSDEDEQVN